MFCRRASQPSGEYGGCIGGLCPPCRYFFFAEDKAGIFFPESFFKFQDDLNHSSPANVACSIQVIINSWCKMQGAMLQYSDRSSDDEFLCGIGLSVCGNY